MEPQSDAIKNMSEFISPPSQWNSVILIEYKQDLMAEPFKMVKSSSRNYNVEMNISLQNCKNVILDFDHILLIIKLSLVLWNYLWYSEIKRERWCRSKSSNS